MHHREATTIAEVLGGEVFQRGRDDGEEDTWFVIFERSDGRLTVLSERSVEEYYDRDSFEKGQCYASVSFV